MPMPSSPGFRTTKDLLAHLDSLNFFHMALSLARMDRVLGELGLARPPYRVIQVVGTNGKGSTATFLASLLEAHGLSVGLYTSPHFVSPAERIQIDGMDVPIEEWLEPASRALAICGELTYFELVTAIAAIVFRDRAVDAAVFEAGLGARYDATSALQSDLAVFTPMALDHTALLGPTLRDIALEKAHAIRGPIPAVTAEQAPEVMEVLRERARTLGSMLETAPSLPARFSLGLAGVHQLSNAATALAAFGHFAKVAGLPVDEEKIERGLARAFIPGRLQLAAPCPETGGQRPARSACLLDGAHNPHGMATLAQAIGDGTVPRPEAVVFSCFRDKDWPRVLETLVGTLPDASYVVPQLEGERAEDAGRIIEALQGLGVGSPRAASSLKEAFESLDPALSPVLVTGSLYLLGEFYELWPEALRRPTPGE